MRLAEDYLQLREGLAGHPEGESFGVSMEDLAGLLYCTTRNAKLILLKLTELGWIRFQSGRGRGHTSELTFLAKPSEILLKRAYTLVEQGDVKAALDWLAKYEGLVSVKTEFSQWLSHYFGYQAEQLENNRILETLRLPIYRPIVTLDPAQAFYAFDTHLINQIYSRLVEYDVESGSFNRGLAHHWSSNEQATVWSFYLSKGIRFHNGRELTGEDVRYSLLRLKEKDCAHGWLVRQLEDVEVVSPYTIRMKLSSPNRLFLLYMSHSAASIISSYTVPSDGSGEEGRGLVVGSGPYQISSKVPGKWVLEVFQDYYGYRGHIDRIEIIIVPEMEEGLQLDMNPGLLVVLTGEAYRPSIPYAARNPSIKGVSLLTLNTHKQGVLQDLYLRKALVHYLDRKQLVEELGETRLYPAKGFHLDSCEGLEDPYHNPELAEHSLRASGYRGEPLQLYTYKRHESDAYWLKDYYGERGIRLEVHIVTWGEMMETERMEAADLILYEAVLREGLIRELEYFQSPKSFIRSSLNQNWRETIDQCAAEIVELNSPEEAALELHTLKEQLVEDYVCVLLVYKAVETISHPSLQDVKLNARGWVDFNRIWFN